MPTKLVIASMSHETNTFSPVATKIDAFGRGGVPTYEKAIAQAEGTALSA